MNLRARHARRVFWSSQSSQWQKTKTAFACLQSLDDEELEVKSSPFLVLSAVFNPTVRRNSVITQATKIIKKIHLNLE
jgi:hypothetical protein